MDREEEAAGYEMRALGKVRTGMQGHGGGGMRAPIRWNVVIYPPKQEEGRVVNKSRN